MRRFLNAAEDHEIIFVRGATEGVNLVAQTYGWANVGAGDEVLITALEHHSNIVPGRSCARKKKAALRVAPINREGEVLLENTKASWARDENRRALPCVQRTRTVNPIPRMIEMAHRPAFRCW